MIKRWLARLLTAAVLVRLLPVWALAADEYNYWVWNDSSKSLVLNNTATDNITENDSITVIDSTDDIVNNTLQKGWYVVRGSVTFDSRITVKENVHLILADGCTLTVNGGIEVAQNQSFTIYSQQQGTGKLLCQKCNFDAAIGGTKNGGCGSVTIYGGIITATGGSNSAGIGSSGNDSSARSGGNITIYGGSVMAQGGASSAGIGGSVGHPGGNINIYGGTVIATGQNGAAGIGGGAYQSAYTSNAGDGGNVAIYGGYVYTNHIGAGGGGGNPSAGTFTTGNTGNAVIVSGSISDQSNAKDWSGIIFQGNDGKIYNSPINLTTDAEIPTNRKLTIANGETLTLGNGVTLTNNGTIEIISGGTLTNHGTINGDGTVAPNEYKLSQDTPPAAPTKDTATENSITLTAMTGGANGVEYTYINGNGGGTPSSWQDSPTFSSLSPGIVYTFYARYKGNGNYQASPPSQGATFYTAPAITTESMSSGYVGVPYSQSLTATSGTAVTWTLASGTLPDGLALNNGTISGTPTKVGTVTFKVRATAGSNANAAGSSEKQLSITINAGTPNMDLTVKNNGSQTSVFTYGDTITIEGTISMSSAAPSSNSLTPPAQNQAALFLGDTQLTEPVAVNNGAFTITYNTALKNIQATGQQQTLTVKYGGSSELRDGAATVTITLNKKEVTATLSGTATKVYDGTDAAPSGLSLALAGVVGTDDVSATATTITYNDANAGDSKTITAHNTALTGAAAVYYTLANSPINTTGSITKATVTGASGSFNIANSLARTYTFVLPNIRPEIGEGCNWGTVSYSIKSVSFSETGYYTEGTAELIADESGVLNTLSLPILFNEVTTTEEVGTVTITTHSENYKDFDSTISIIATNKQAVNFGGVAGVTEPYDDGNPNAGYSGNLVVTNANSGEQIPLDDVSIEILYTGRVDTSYGDPTTAAPPTNAGTYFVVFRVADTDPNYIGRQAFPFEITKIDGEGSVRMDNVFHGETPGEPYVESSTNGTDGVIFYYKPQGASDSEYTEEFPTEEGLYTVRAVFPGNRNYNAVTATDDFSFGHVLVDEWSSDSGYHWRECTVEGCPATENSEKGGYGPHIPGEWIVDRPVTTSQEGRRHRECTVCGYLMDTESIPATGSDEDSRPNRKPNTGGGSSSSSKPTEPSPTEPLPPTVEPPKSGGGTPEVSPADPRPGDSVTVTPKPDNGYQVNKITVTDQNGNPVEVIQNPDGTFRFTQPAGKVTIEMTYVPLSGFPFGEWVNPFTDVFESDWFYDAVAYVVQNGLFSGTSATTFSPNMPMTRGMLVTVLYRAAGTPDIENEIWGYPYADVDAAAYYGTAVYWARLRNIASGYSDERFGPNDPITREQLIVMLWRYAGSPAPVSRTLTAPDAGQIGDYALDAICWAVENGILNGDSSGKLNPQAQATRAEVAQILKSFIEKNP